MTVAQQLEPINKLTKDLREASRVLSQDEARFLVDSYYTMQNDRIRAANQVRSLSKDNEPCEVLQWLFGQTEQLEKQVLKALTAYAESDPVGKWSLSICGVGPVIAAGLLAHIDMNKAPNPGHILSFAGLKPQNKWLSSENAKKKYEQVVGKAKVLDNQLLTKICTEYNKSPEALCQVLLDQFPDHYSDGMALLEGYQIDDKLKKYLSMRPFNSKLKVLCWKIGQSFVKVSSNKNDFYGKLFRQRKEYEVANNEKNLYAEQAARQLLEKNYSKSTEAYKHLITGKLPPGQIQLRAERWAVKLFLSHYWEIAYQYRTGQKPTQVYSIVKLGYDESSRIDPPNNPF